MSSPVNGPIRWGILGTGNIAKQFARGLAADPGSVLAAAGSRSQASSDAFAKEFPCRAHGSYEALCADPAIDAIYVASPHVGHREHALLAIRNRKAVLVEKPFAVNEAQVRAVVDAARANRTFCMEAMWTRCLPTVRQASAWLDEQAIGDVRLVTADFGFRCGWDPTSRLLDPAMGGGALLDVGVYTVAMAWFAFRRAPATVRATAVLGATGVDEQMAMTFGWADGGLANLTCAVRTSTRHDAVIYGTTGRIELPDFWHGTKAILHQDGKPSQTLDLPFLGNGYTHEAMEVGRCLRAGLTESPIIPLDESLAITRTMDECRRQVGLAYPVEKAGATA